MNFDVMGQIIILLLLVQTIRYLLFEHPQVQKLWVRFHNVPVAGTLFTCPWCQGFWLGLAMFGITFWIRQGIVWGAVQGLVWGLISGWIGITWHNWSSRSKDNNEKNSQTVKTVSNHVPESDPEQPDNFNDQTILLESNIDDMSGEFFGGLMERLFAAGAVDVWFTSAYGKKNRPLYQLSALTPPAKELDVTRVIFEHSSTAGIRRRIVQRVVMDRSFVEVNVKGEKIAVKRLSWRGIVKYTPEWNDCAEASRKLGLPVSDIYSSAQVKAKQIDGIKNNV